MARLADAIAAEVTTGGTGCTVPPLLAKLTRADRADLEAALADVTIPAAAIVRALHKAGHKIGETTVRRHRRSGCTCAAGSAR